ncbi:hypothetical protein [Bradyrhizobium sp. CCH5-F6]|jgi:hypothetical protein|uniref:hypothetical protein n=1 Tax=Bradyrhizobium sp. CCH5-F6 TaxID=1768753 RepID=UPI0012E3B0C2|nr:hypothetical protein [Bradyrhizobium sp. CCH5-F6]
MSSKPIAPPSRIKLRTTEAGAYRHAPAINRRSMAKVRRRRQPHAEDFQVALDLPPSPPILDRELRAIEVLLGRELQELLASDGTDSSEK